MGSSTPNRAGTARIDGLNPDDPGISRLAQAVAGRLSREILLVCCGDVPGVGPEATRLVLDVREREGAVARTVGVDEVDEARGSVHGPHAAGFGDAIVWPRPHLGKDFSVWCLARGALALRPGGSLWCAARKAKGAESLVEELHAMMGAVEVVARDKGYRVVRAQRTGAFDEARARASVGVRYVIEDPALPGLSLGSAPGVFSRRELDGGTRQLIEHAAMQQLGSPSTVLDLGCGVGPLALWAALRWPAARVIAVDSNLRAVALARENAARHGLAGRVRVLASDGLPPTPQAPEQPAAEDGEGLEPFALALVNPPTHAEPEVLGRLCEDLRRWLLPGGVAMLVVSRPGRMTEQLVRAGASVEPFAYPRFTVLHARWG